MRTSTRSRALAAVLVAPLLMLPACGDDEEKEPAAPTVSASPSTPADGESSAAPGSEEGAEGGEVAGTEVEDPAGLFLQMQRAMRDARTAHVSMDLGMGQARGLLSYGRGAPEMALTMDLGEGRVSGMQLRYVGGEMYLSMPGLTPAGKFFRFDRRSKTLGPMVGQLRNLTPDASAKLMRKSLRTMVEVGDEEIDGEQTTHYVVTVDTKRATRLAGGSGAAWEQLEGMPATVEYDLWVTEDKLIRRFVMNQTGLSMQMDYTRWGDPVDIEKPAAADVVEAPAGM